MPFSASFPFIAATVSKILPFTHQCASITVDLSRFVHLESRIEESCNRTIMDAPAKPNRFRRVLQTPFDCHQKLFHLQPTCLCEC